MTYSQGGLIQAADYNTFANAGGQLNWVWATGNGDQGYGQPFVANISVGGLVTAGQWSSMITVLNSALTHQSGSGSGISSSISAGQTINYLSTLATNINTAYTNRGNFATQGTVVTGTNYLSWANAAAAAAFGPSYLSTRTVTFSGGADAARYFFNAGGQINYVISSVTNFDSTARTGDAVTLLATDIGGLTAFRNKTTGGRTGTGGTLNTNNTTSGYRNLTTAQTTFIDVTSTTASYTTDNANIRVRSNGVQGANGDTGSILYFDLGVTFPAHSTFNGTLTAGVNHRIDIIPPETTNLTNSWGTITVT